MYEKSQSGVFMFEQENAFYEANKDSLRGKYLGKELVIVGDQLIGAYDNAGTAFAEAVKTYPLGQFCIRDVPVDPEDEEVYIPWVFPFRHVDQDVPGIL
jgi:hypothetical protein